MLVPIFFSTINEWEIKFYPPPSIRHTQNAYSSIFYCFQTFNFCKYVVWKHDIMCCFNSHFHDYWRGEIFSFSAIRFSSSVYLCSFILTRLLLPGLSVTSLILICRSSLSILEIYICVFCVSSIFWHPQF